MKKFIVPCLFLAIACGKRGDPRPPVPVIPQATSDLVVTQRATRILLSWSYPSLTTAGRSLPAVRRVTLYRYIEELPPTAAPAPGTPPEPAQPDAVTQFAVVPLLVPAQFDRLSSKVDSIEGANLPAATAGAKLIYEDTPPFRADSGRPVRVTYGVVTEGVSARSELSNLAAIVPLDVAVSPTGLTATADARGVVLQWNAPQTAATDPRIEPIIVGYNVYRDPAEELGPPINATPITGTTFTDTPPYGEHRYRVTAVASAGPPRIESEPSALAETAFKDLVPPPPPGSVSALVEIEIVRLIWEPVDASDLDGYHVYRWEWDKPLRLTIGPARQTHFGDSSAVPGADYKYGISAIDKSGNESEQTFSQPVMVPKTP